MDFGLVARPKQAGKYHAALHSYCHLIYAYSAFGRHSQLPPKRRRLADGIAIARLPLRHPLNRVDIPIADGGWRV